jgi:peptide-methionine (S)-S-oxide reductase
MSDNMELATLGGGCFWCLEAVFEDLNGIEKVESGYSGGTTEHPSYEQVCSGATGHAEVVQLTFSPAHITYREILEVFFSIHDPTTRNRQGADVGTQYRSVIFYHSEAQKETAASVLNGMNSAGIWGGPIVTILVPYREFYKAEDYHQRYFSNNPNQGYCRAVVAPKVAKFRSKFISKLKSAAG